MTPKIKITLRLSEVRARLNEISGLDELTDEVRNEAEALQGEYKDLEIRHRAAIVSEAEAEAQAAGKFPSGGDAETAELRSLLTHEDTSVSTFLSRAATGSALDGRAAELNAALDVPTHGKSGGINVPWHVLAGPEARAEERAFTTTATNDGSTMQRPILQRLFGPGVMDLLGVRIESVPSGMAEWPLVTSGVAPAMKVEASAANAAVALGQTFEILKPKRLTGKYEFTHEAAAQVPSLEAALRRDLGDAIRSKMSDLILNGDETTNAHEPDGFLTTIAAPTVPGAVAGWTDFAALASAGVDGIHASRESQCNAAPRRRNLQARVASLPGDGRVQRRGSGPAHGCGRGFQLSAGPGRFDEYPGRSDSCGGP